MLGLQANFALKGGIIENRQSTPGLSEVGANQSTDKLLLIVLSSLLWPFNQYLLIFGKDSKTL